MDDELKNYIEKMFLKICQGIVVKCDITRFADCVFFFNHENTFIFIYNYITGEFIVSTHHIMMPIREIFSLSVAETCTLVKELVRKHLITGAIQDIRSFSTINNSESEAIKIHFIDIENNIKLKHPATDLIELLIKIPITQTCI